MDAIQRIEPVAWRRKVPVLNGYTYEVVFHWSTKTGEGWEPLYDAQTLASKEAAREAEIAGLREALEPFVDYPAETLSLGADEGFTMTVRGFHLHNAVAALTTHPKE